jgi:hypothetical protein
MKKIASVGLTIPGDDIEHLNWNSCESLSEFDIVIISPADIAGSFQLYFSVAESFEGKTLYSKEVSTKILDASEHWKKEISYFLENGGTVVLQLKKKEEFYIYTGKTNVTGNGKNATRTNLVTEFSNYHFIPPLFKVHNAIGKKVYANSSVVSEFVNQFSSYLNYEAYIESQIISKSAFTTKNKDRMLGAHLRIRNGFLLLVPNLQLDFNALTYYDEEKDETYWTKEAIQISKHLVTSFIEIDKTFRGVETKSVKPVWVVDDQFSLIESKDIIQLIANNNIIIGDKLKENENLEAKLDEKESLKHLLYETGKPLENAVINALKIIGFEAENYNDGMLEIDQVIISPEGHRYLGECEGKDNKDIDVSKFRQLLDGLNEDFEREEVNEKALGLLFGNAQRLMSPAERSLSFTSKCQAGAKREKIGLVKTEDLFYICRYILETNDKEFARSCRMAIHSQLGEIINFPTPPIVNQSNDRESAQTEPINVIV